MDIQPAPVVTARLDGLSELADATYETSGQLVSIINELEQQPFVESISPDLRAMREAAQKAHVAAEQAVAAWKRYADRGAKPRIGDNWRDEFHDRVGSAVATANRAGLD